MKDTTLETACPCCGAQLAVDLSTGEARTVSPGTPAAPLKPKGKKTLDQELAALKRQEAAREGAFERSLAKNKQQTQDMDRRFADLLKRQEGQKPTAPDWRDIDLD